VGNFGETEKLFLLNIDQFSEFILLGDFSNYYNVIYDLYFNLCYYLNMVEKSYESFNFGNFLGDMAVDANNQISDFDDSASDSNQVIKKSEPPVSDKQIFLVDAKNNFRRKPDTENNFRSDFF
jgi:hypothetical protein